jgi:hypothetical protein
MKSCPSSHASLAAALFAASLLIAGCALPPAPPAAPTLSPAEARALIVRALPASVADRAGWATDIHAAFAAMELPETAETICAVIAVTQQESGFRVDPPVPGLAAMAWKEIDAQAERAGVPRAVVRAALHLTSSDGRSYAERIDAARTEKQLSDTFDDFIGLVPLGRRLLADRNPVRTAGPMQVAVAFAQSHAAARGYPYPVAGTIRDEVFTRRGGLYFGIAHLLDYAAPYDRPLYRYADFNAGRWASRNAAFQNAVSAASGVPLELDGDLVRPNAPADRPGATELATRALARRLELSAAEIRRDLERGTGAGFERTPLYGRVFALADRVQGSALPRAVLPRIVLAGPKIQRKLTTEWFARRVDERHRQCLERVGAAAG